MTCTCAPLWPALVATIDGEDRAAEPADAHSAAESETHARCRGCGATYPDHWTLTPIEDPEGAARAAGPPKNAVELLRRVVASRSNGEVRPQQEHMVELVEKAMKERSHLLVQAGTGTGKSLGYLIPAIKSGRRVVVSTATKQLSEQIVNDDMPVLADLMPKVGGPRFTYALIKGRSNYACLRDIDAMLRLDEQANDQIQEALFEPTARENSRRPSNEDLKSLNDLLKWADATETGDRSDAPAVPDRVWDQVSTDAASCAGAKACPFGEQCFAELARATAREADIVVTNHAQVAQDLRSPAPLLGDYDILVTDEVHELESYLSSAWGQEVNPASMKHHIALTSRKLPKGATYDPAREVVKNVIADIEALDEMLDGVDEGLQPELPKHVADLLVAAAHKLRDLANTFDHASGEKNASSQTAAERKGASGKVLELCEAVVAVAADMSDGKNVRWLEARRGNFGPVLKVAPLWVGPQLMELLGPKTLISTSATITVGGTFDSFIRTLALNEPVIGEDGEPAAHRPYNAVDVGTPFDYRQQAMIYVPTAPFPSPEYANRDNHKAAVKEDVTALVKAAGGRTLALFTTRRAAEDAAEHLRKSVRTPVLCQGDAPPSQLIRDFKNDESATLCATMGFWHGVDAPGATCTTVILDKIPFAPMNDPLMVARRAAVEAAGRSGFDEVFVASAAVMLAQGVGRLIRTATDRGVVAILDTRLRTKGYGATLFRSMPPMWQAPTRDVVEKSLKRLAADADAARQTPTPTSPTTRVAAPQDPPAAPRKAAPSRASTRALARTTKGAPTP